MEFVQVVSFESDKTAQELIDMEVAWRDATRGRRTNVIEWFLTDRENPRRKIAINGFRSWDAAVTNSSLPETNALSQEIGAVIDGDIAFFNGDLVDQAAAEREAVVAAVLEMFASGALAAGLFAEDVFFDLNVPQWRFQLQGVDALREYLVREGEASSIDSSRVAPMPGGFFIEIATRNEAAYCRQAVVVETAGGLITRMTLYCTGEWDSQTEARQRAEAPMIREGWEPHG